MGVPYKHCVTSPIVKSFGKRAAHTPRAVRSKRFKLVNFISLAMTLETFQIMWLS